MKQTVASVFLMVLCGTLTFTSCRHNSLEDRAEQECREYTEKYCPTPVADFQRTDSITFTRGTHTFNYYYTLVGKADSAALVRKIRPQVIALLRKRFNENTRYKAYKEAGYKFRFVFRSDKTGATLLETTLNGRGN